MNTDRKYVGPSHRALYGSSCLYSLEYCTRVTHFQSKAICLHCTFGFYSTRTAKMGASWEEIGIKFRNIGKDFISNWHLFLLVAVILQIPIPLIARRYWPDLLQHIRARIPFLSYSSIISYLLTVIIITFFEELIYRGCLQQRLNWYLNGIVSVIIASIVFGLQHFTPGKPAVVAVDMSLVAIDGIVYGWIFARCKNVLVSWPAHVIADIVGFIMLLLV